MKNPRGFGSVYKMRDCRRKKPWRAVSPAIKEGTTNKLKRISIGTFSTKMEAMEALINYNKKPYDIFSKKLTFLKIIEIWKNEHLKNVSLNREKNILSRLRKMEPLFNLVFSEIKLFHLQFFFNNLNIASGTKKEYKSIINLIFEFGIKYELIEKNPVPYVDIGRHAKVREPNVFTMKEIKLLWDKQFLLFVDTILILIYTGVRIGELLSIVKSNVFLEERYIIGGSKTNAGKNRIIPIHKDIIPLIKNRLKESNTFLIEHSGKQINYSYYNKIFKSIIEELNLSTHRIHDTRHTFATIISETNANQTSIKNIIGHSSYYTTEKIYTHKRKEELIKAIDCINLKY
ncbi:tyrosine-type recombinase/integrase [Fusobacterium sp. PH5-44]|uniref:tyrosine-type recombinase/integrase n=1 Tax=unclassified Fusobacterium TaxID=2648384 RepID=UPI003D1F951F